MNQHLKTNAAGIALIKQFESCKLTAYLCPAALELPAEERFYTIGWGNTFYEDGSPVKKGDKITQERADKLFLNILEGFENMAKKAINVPLTSNQFSAFVSALYNVGPGGRNKSGLITLKNGNPSTLLRRINSNPSDKSIAAAFLMWVSPGSKFENGLRRRRIKEALLYFN